MLDQFNVQSIQQSNHNRSDLCTMIGLMHNDRSNGLTTIDRMSVL